MTIKYPQKYLLSNLFVISSLILIISEAAVLESPPQFREPRGFLKQHVNDMLKYMDQTANPCENFNQYACGNWKNYQTIPDDKESYDIFGKLNDNLRQKILDILILETRIILDGTQDHNLKFKKLVRNLFGSCFDTKTINERKEEPLLKFLEQLGGFPLLDNDWSEDNFHLEDILATLADYKIGTLLSVTVENDLEKENTKVITVFNPALGLTNNDDYLKEENKLNLNAYREYIIENLRILKADETKIEKFANEVIALETKLANLTDTRELRLIDQYKVKKLSDLMEFYPKFNWKYYFEKSVEIELADDTKIVFFTGPNIDEIYNILTGCDKRELLDYLNWCVIRKTAKYLDDRFREPLEKLTKVLTGTDKFSKSRALDCATITNDKLGFAISAIYIRRNFNEDSKIDILNIAKEIKQKFRDNLINNDWLDDETKRSAEIKVDKTAFAFGYPEFLLNYSLVNKYHDGLELENNEYFENILRIKKFSLDKKISKLYADQSFDITDWIVKPTVVNAFFESDKNRITVPASFIQPPVYYKDFPNSMKYGGIGAFIGHELTHGFDANGRSFDEKGNFKNWWTNASVAAFNDKEQCFIDQYSKFSIANKSLNGNLSKVENIADNGGLQLSFNVYKSLLSKLSVEEKNMEVVKGLEFLTPEQLFFLHYAQSWCDYTRPEALEKRLATDEHPPGIFRLTGAFQNFDGFSKAYQCSDGSYMNPTEKCKLW